MDAKRIVVGTQSLGSDSWMGRFYPPDLASRDRIVFYSQVFGILELNVTFYAPISRYVIRSWVERTPQSLLFSAKLPKAITHEKRLLNAEDELRAFCASMRDFRDRLAAAVVQLPPSFDRSSEADLRAFLALLPDDLAFTVEFRHPSWQHPDILALLADHRVAWCMNEYRDLAPTTEVTSDWAYVRLNGYHERYSQAQGPVPEREDDLAYWAGVLSNLPESVLRTYVLINDHYAGHAPDAANDLKRRLGLPTADPQSLWSQLRLT